MSRLLTRRVSVSLSVLALIGFIVLAVLLRPSREGRLSIDEAISRLADEYAPARQLSSKDYSNISDVTTPEIWSRLKVQVFDCGRTQLPDFVTDGNKCYIISGRIGNSVPVVTDLDSNGVPELVYISYSGSGVLFNKVSILSSGETGNYASREIYIAGYYPWLRLKKLDDAKVEIVSELSLNGSTEPATSVALIAFDQHNKYITVNILPDLPSDIKTRFRFWRRVPDFDTRYIFDEHGDITIQQPAGTGKNQGE